MGAEGIKYYFATLPRCMWTLVLQGIIWDGTRILMDELVSRKEFKTFAAIFVFVIFVLLTTITVLNLLVGVLIDVVRCVAAGEAEEASTNLVKEIILTLLKKFDDGDGLITEEELNEVMIDAKAVAVLEAVGVD